MLLSIKFNNQELIKKDQEFIKAAYDRRKFNCKLENRKYKNLTTEIVYDAKL